VPQGLGSVKIAMRDFDGPEEFLESLRDADIVRKRQSLLYVQALKFIQTKSPAGRKSTGSGGQASAGGDSAGSDGRTARGRAAGGRRGKASSERKSPGSGNK
jgi:hypothetical protein